MSNQRWMHRPEGSNWGDFGPDDQRGRLNLIDRRKVLDGIAEVKTGETFCLSLPLDYPGGSVLNPNRLPPVIRPTLRNGDVNFNYCMERLTPQTTDVLSDDLATLHLQYSTQWDGLAHVGSRFDIDGNGEQESVYYNGYRAGSDIKGPDHAGDAGVPCGHGVSTSQAFALGIENMATACVQGRGVLVDLQRVVGSRRTVIGYEAFQRALEACQADVETGDVLCLRTGFAEALLSMQRNPRADDLASLGAVLDGRDKRLLNWITDSGVAAIAADNYAVENYPASQIDGYHAALPLHEHCLFKLGIHLGELWHFGPLAARLSALGRTRFLLTAPPLNLPGAVASPVTPVATI